MQFFGEKIRRLREEQDLPLRKVAAYLDIDTSILSKIERSERSANPELIEKLAVYFRVDVKELFAEYLGEEVAKKVYQTNDLNRVFEVAEKKAEYLKSKSQKQGELKF